jgi:hypothetical protein
MEIQRAMLAANLRSSQEALAFLGRMQSLENSQGLYKIETGTRFKGFRVETAERLRSGRR